MRMTSWVTFLIVLLTLWPGLLAAEDADVVDFENVPTPVTLPELLPEGGIDAVDVDFWMWVKVTSNGEPVDHERFMHWSAKPVDGNLVFVIETGQDTENKQHSHTTTIYDKDGRLISFHQVSREYGKITEEVKGSIYQDELVMKTSTFDTNGELQGVKTENKSIAFFKSTVPSEWFSLIAAYHIRKESLGYSFDRTDIHYRYQFAQTRLKDVGVEDVAFNGKTMKAHMLVGERSFGSPNSRNIAKLTYLMAPNGDMMATRTEQYGMLFTGQRVTREQVREKFWLPETQNDDAKR